MVSKAVHSIAMAVMILLAGSYSLAHAKTAEVTVYVINKDGARELTNDEVRASLGDKYPFPLGG